VRRSWRVRAEGEAALKTLSARLAALPAVCGYVLDPRDD
jgi:putative Mg2+ transporter-C (MgtC) family protein